jgi:hypothetical protein
MKKKGVELPSLFWRDVVGYEGLYQVSIDGEVKNVKTGRILRPCKSHKGYLLTYLYKDGKGKGYSVHRLVARAWIPNPDNLPQVNHINEDKTDNRVENLEWVTAKENVNWATGIERAAKTKRGVYNIKTSKPVYQYTLDGQFIKEYPSTHEVERQTGFSHTNISACCLGKYGRKTAYGYKWCYKYEEPVKSIIALDKQGRIVHVFPSTMEAGRNGFNQSCVSACCIGKQKTHKGLFWRYQNDFLKKIC